MIFEVNKSHKDFFLDVNRWLVSYGGAGSGKSWTTGQKILTRILTEENHKFLICRKVANTLRVSVFQLFKDLIYNANLENQFKINKSDMTITNTRNGSTFLFMGLDNIEKLKSIQGITGIWIEEVSECQKGDILELNRRLRGETKYYKQIILTFNPISHLHWLKEHFFDNPNSKASIYKTTYLDNSFIDEEYKKEIEDIQFYDEQQYRIYALGEWGVLNNNIIHHRFKPLEHLSDKTVNEFNILHIGVDFNIGACCCVALGEDNQGYAHIVDEFTAYDTENIIITLQNRYRNKEIILYPDASGGNRSTNSTVTDIQMLKNAGFYCVVPSGGNGSTSGRYNACNRKLMSNTLLINKNLAPKTYESLQVHAYTDKGLPQKFDTHPSIDDRTDSFGYVVGRLYPVIQKSFKVQVSTY